MGLGQNRQTVLESYGVISCWRVSDMRLMNLDMKVDINFHFWKLISIAMN